MLPQTFPRGGGPEPCAPAPVMPTFPCPDRPAGRKEIRQLVDLLKSLVGKELLIQVDNLVHKGKLISVDPVLVVSGDGKVCFIQLEAIKAVDF